MYTIFIFDPIINALIFFYSLFNDMGIAIIIITIIIRLILFPLSKKALLTTQKIQEIYPKINQITKEFKHDRQRLNIEVMKIYKEANVNPILPFINLAVQITILIALYQALQVSQDPSKLLSHLYSITPHPQELNYIFLGFINLSLPNIYFAFIAAAATFWQLKISLAFSRSINQTDSLKNKNEPLYIMQQMTRQLNIIMPFIIFFGAIKLSAALSLYWVISTLFTVGQEYYLKYQHSKIVSAA